MQYLYPISSGSSIFHFFEGVSSSPTGPFFLPGGLEVQHHFSDIQRI